ncbi:MAG: alpha/beta hydrolase-fold protein [Bacteroidota bacterium]
MDEHLIKSEHLGYDVRYWVHVPEGFSGRELPALYVTDGKWYCERGDIVALSRSLIREGKVDPHLLVLVDAFDPNNESRNRRNQQFLCNPDYVSFYREELIPEIQQRYAASKSREDTGLLGLSFGGLNSMYFAIHASDLFGKIGIQSPAPHPCPDIFDEFVARDRLPIDIYLSTGTVNDKARDTRRLKRILEEKGYEFKYQEVPEGHNWKNWKPLLDDILLHFYGI